TRYGADVTGARKCHAMTVDARRRSAFGVLFEELDRVADGQNGLRRVVGNLATEFLFEGHDKFDRVEAIGAEIIDEAGVIRDLVGLDAQMLHDDLLSPLANITHCSNLFVRREPINAVLVLSWLGPCRGLVPVVQMAVGRCDSEADIRPALRRSGSPAPSRFGYHTSKPLTSAADRDREWTYPLQIITIPPFTCNVCPVT